MDDCFGFDIVSAAAAAGMTPSQVAGGHREEMSIVQTPKLSKLSDDTYLLYLDIGTLMGKKGKGKAKARTSGPVKSSSGPGKAAANLATTVSDAPLLPTRAPPPLHARVLAAGL